MKKNLLILNLGSSSLKFAVFVIDKKVGVKILDGSITLTKNLSVVNYQLKNKKYKINYQSGYNIKNWWRYIYDLLADLEIHYVGFRLVHGGEEFTDTVRVNNQFLQRIKKYAYLAPLHNPPAIKLMEAVKDTWPTMPMAASFDTGWFKTLPPVAYLYALPWKYCQQHKIRKYGFHGLNHEMAAKFAGQKVNKPLAKLNVITCHLGSGNSLAWFANGKVQDTTLGFSTNEGLIMSTRSGDVPAGVIFYLARELKMPLSEIEDLLNKKSGLLGLAGSADLREVLAMVGQRVPGWKPAFSYSPKQRQQAKLALSVYIYQIQKHLGSYLSRNSKLDAIVFTGTVGYRNPLIRKLILRGLVRPKNCKILIMPDLEMENIAFKTKQCLS